MRRRLTYVLALGMLLLPGAGYAQDGLSEGERLDIQTRLNQFLDNLGPVYEACKAKLPLSNDVQLTEGYLRTLERRVKNLDQSLNSLGVRWNNYFPAHQKEISQDEGLMDGAQSFELLRQEASDSLDVRKKMVQALRDFSDAKAYMESLDTVYNSMGKKAFELSLSSKTAPLLEKQKMKEQLLFATVQEKFDNAREAEALHVVSAQRMEALEDIYAALKNKSETIQAMTYKPLIQRIKDYLLGLAAVAVLLMFINMVRTKIKAAKDAKENMKKYKDALHLNGQDEFPTI